MRKCKKSSAQKPSEPAPLVADLKSLIHDHTLFFDRLVDLIPARFYVPVLDGQERPWFHGLSKAAKASAKKESRENLKKARRARFNPDQSTSTIDLLQKTINDEKQSWAAEEDAIENASSNGDCDAKVGDQRHVVSEDRSVTYEELRQRLRHRIEELRGNRNTRNPNKTEDQRREKRKKIKWQSRNGGDAPHRKRKRDEGTGKGEHDQKKSKRAKDVDISYGKVKLGGMGEKERKKMKLSKQQELENARKLEEAKKDPDRGKMVAEKHSWRAAMSRAVGKKVHDDPRVLQQSLKKEQKRHQKHAEKWKERVESQNKIREEKQKARAENIRERIQQRKMRRVEKREKKLMRPGFEGRKEGYINQ